jgi:deoxycytidine triphosphate deaminase
MANQMSQEQPQGKEGLLPFASPHSLMDAQIGEAVENVGLIGGDYKMESARYASCELYASDYAEKLVYDNEVTGHVELPTTEKEIVVGPGSTVKLYTSETVNLPSNMFALVIVLGQLFSVGLSAGSTYVDPGLQGEIYISLTNISARAIRIPVGCPIVRTVFFVL